MVRSRLALVAAPGACVLALLAGCGGSASSSPGASSGQAPGGRGGELLGQHRRAARRREGRGQSIITNPNTDPHGYEPTAADARTIADAQTGDRERDRLRHWASKLLAANPVERADRARRRRPARAQGRRQPAPVVHARSVQQVIDAIVADYERLDPADAAYFAAAAHDFETRRPRRYNPLRSEIRASTPARRSAQREHLRAARRRRSASS